MAQEEKVTLPVADRPSKVEIVRDSLEPKNSYQI